MKRSGRFNLFSLLPISILFLAFGCQEQSEKPKTESVKAPEQIISTNQAQELFDNYSSRRAPLIQKFEDSLNKESRFDVARYGYYDYKTIKKYIAYIEQEAEKAKVEISTLRFYFGNYPNKQKFKDGRAVKHPRQNSFFIVPTLKKDGKEFPFSVVSNGKENYNAKLLKNNFKISKSKEVGSLFYHNEKSSASIFPNFFNKPANLLYDDEGSLILNEIGVVPPPYGQD